MPKYRKLHTKTVESLDLNEMPDDLTRLMWVLLPLALCREGRGLHSGAWLKSKLFPLREDINSELVWQKFQWFVGRGMVVPYEVEGRSYFYVPTFHKYQGNTVKEAESDYPPPPDLVETGAGDTEAEVQTDSEPTPELVQSKSGTDAVFSIQYSDADTTEGADAPNNGPATFADWQELIRTSKNRPADLVAMHERLYPGRDPPDFGYMGKIARQVGGAGRMAELLWQHSTRPPTGDVLAYVLAVSKGGKKHGATGNGDRVVLQGGYVPEPADPAEFYDDDG